MTHEDLAANIFTNPGETPGNGIDDDANGMIDCADFICLIDPACQSTSGGESNCTDCIDDESNGGRSSEVTVRAS